MARQPFGLIAGGVLLGVLVAVATGPPASGQGRATPRYGNPVLVASTDFTDLGGVASVDSADFNGDGFVDVVITKHNRDTLDTYAPIVS